MCDHYAHAHQLERLSVGAGANVLVFGRFETAVISDSRPPFVHGLDCLMSSKSLK